MLFTILLTTLYIGSACIEINQNPDQNIDKYQSLAYCLGEINQLNAHFYKFSVVVYEDDVTEKHDDLFTESLMDVIVSTKITFTKTDNISNLLQVPDISISTILIIIYSKSCEYFLQIDSGVIVIKFKYIIVIDEFLHDECKTRILKKLPKLAKYDATIITPDSNNTGYDLSTIVPELDEITCQLAKSNPIVNINACKNGLDKKLIIDVFPNKALTNFKKCNINVGMAVLYPYSTLTTNDSFKDLDPTDSYTGADMEIIKILASKFNSSLKIFYIYRDEANPYLHFNLRHYLKNETLDVCAGGLYRIYGEEVEYSGIYSSQTIIWVYAAERKIRSWESLAAKTTGLYVFIIIYLIHAILLKVICTFDNQETSVQDSLLYGWGTLLGATALKDVKTIKPKILNIMYLILCLHFSAYVNTQIYSYLTIERPPESFKTLDDLIYSDKTPYLVPISKYFVSEKKFTAFVNTSRSCETFEECEESLIKNKGSTILIDGHLPSFQAATAVNDEARVLKVVEDILIIYHEMVLSKTSPIVNKFQKNALKLFEAGITNKLYVDAIGITVVDRARIANKNILSNGYSCTVGCAITLLQSAGAFYLWMIGCGISCCVFTLELLIASLHISLKDLCNINKRPDVR